MAIKDIAAPISRTRIVLLGSGSMLGAKVLATISGLLITSLLARSLSNEEFGMWAVIGSFLIFWVGGGFDFGLGQGLRNKLAAMASDPAIDNQNEQRDCFLSIFYVLLLVAVIGVALSIFLGPLIPWGKILNINDSTLNNAATPLIITVFTLFFLNLPFGLNVSSFLAYQEAHWRSSLDAIQSILLLLITFITIQLFSFVDIVIGYYATYGILAIISTLLFLKKRGWRPVALSIRTQLDHIKPLAKVSLQFWLLGISAIIISSTDPIIVSQVAGLSRAGDFSLIQKLFLLLTTTHFTILNPLWSAYTQAAQAGDWVWIRKGLKRSIYFTMVLFIGGGSLIIILYQQLIYLWTGKEINNLPLVIAMALWALLSSWSNCNSILINALNLIKLQATLAVFSALINIPLSLYLGYRYGLIGVTIGTILSILPVAISNQAQVSCLLRKQMYRDE